MFKPLKKAFRSAACAGLFILCAVQAAATQEIALRASVTVEGGLVTLGDLFENLAGSTAEIPVFRSPDPGQSGVVSVGRVVAAAENHGVYWDNHGLLAKVTVSRAATEVPLESIRAAVTDSLRSVMGLDTGAKLAVELRHDARALKLHPASSGRIQVASLRHDAGSGLFIARVVPADGPDTEQDFLFHGSAIEQVKVPVLTRFIAQGTKIAADDVVIAERPKKQVPPGVMKDMSLIIGKAARRDMLAEHIVRPADLTDFVKIPVVTRSLSRGEEVTAEDVTMKPVARNLVPLGIETSIDGIVGKAARHNLLADHPVRPDELVELVEVPVLTRAVARGARIGPRDVEMRSMAINVISRGVERNMDLIVGKSARRSLGAGYPVHPNDLEEPLMVQRNRLVAMVFQTNSLTLSARGRALEDGSKDDIVRVVNIRSQKTLEAVVIGPEKVAVIGGNSLALTANLAEPGTTR